MPILMIKYWYRLHGWHHPSLQDWMDDWMDHSWWSPPNSSEAMGISTYSSRYPMNSCDIWISYEYHMKIIWISYEYHVNIMWISLSLVSLSLTHQMFNPFHDTWNVAEPLPGMWISTCQALRRWVRPILRQGNPGNWRPSLSQPLEGRLLGVFRRFFR